jgi:hypothetical protein
MLSLEGETVDGDEAASREVAIVRHREVRPRRRRKLNVVPNVARSSAAACNLWRTPHDAVTAAGHHAGGGLPQCAARSYYQAVVTLRRDGSQSV